MKKIFFPISLLLLALIGLQCTKDSAGLSNDAGSTTAISGSYAKSLIVGNQLYIATKTDLITFDLTDKDKPIEKNRQTVASQVESLYQFNGKLFVGSGQGMFIYDISSGIPAQLSATIYQELFDNILPCDPIVATDSFAYVTLNTSVEAEICRRPVNQQVNQLNVFDITDLEHPVLIGEYFMNQPKGLALDGTTLFVCDGDNGLKVFDTSNPYSLETIETISGFEAYDVITLDGLLLVIGPDNVYQFDYSDVSNIVKISEIPYGA